MENEILFKNYQTKINDQGQLEAVFSTFGVIDRDGDIVEATALTHGQSVPLVWGHDWLRPVGKGSVEVTQSEAIFRGAFFLDTQAGEEAYKTVKAMGDLQEYSYGFLLLDSAYETRDEKPVRIIKRIELFEVSPVLVGAGVGTRTLALKSRMSFEQHIETARDAVVSIGERVRSVVGIRAEQGRKLSAERQDELRILSGELRKVAGEIETALAPIPDPINVRQLYNQFLQTEAHLNGVSGDK